MFVNGKKYRKEISIMDLYFKCMKISLKDKQRNKKQQQQ